MVPLRAVLLDCYTAGQRAVAPDLAMVRALGEVVRPSPTHLWIVAVGKAAGAMVRGTLQALGTDRVGGGLVVTPDPPPPVPGPITWVRAEHPIPGDGTLEAATRLGELVERLGPNDTCWLLLSGGATSLLAAPVEGITDGELREVMSGLYRAGLPIASMNRIRGRLTRWGAGKLAVALRSRGAGFQQFIVSDVVGNRLPAIGSGPGVAPETTPGSDLELLHSEVAEHLPAPLVTRVTTVLAAQHNPDPDVFAGAEPRIVADNGMALAAIAARARSHHLTTVLQPDPLLGDAAEAGRAFAAELAHRRYTGTGPALLVRGGETTVTLSPSNPDGRTAEARVGGRCQEFALAAAETLAMHKESGAAILALGTDGRDGPTDAAGAFVTPATWDRIRSAGHDPVALLAAHRSYSALNAVSALIRTGPTGTNVMDVVLGWVG